MLERAPSGDVLNFTDSAAFSLPSPKRPFIMPERARGKDNVRIH
jgi:hypothetical protein